MSKHHIYSFDLLKKLFRPKTNVSDVEGHYDIDGVSMAETVIVAGEEPDATLKKLNDKSGDIIPTEYLPLSEKSLQEIQNQADTLSFKQKNQKAPAEDGKPDKHDQFTSAKYDSRIEEYLQFEKAGD